MEFLAPVAVFVLGIVVFALRDRAADRRRARAVDGGVVRCRALLGRSSGALRRGTLACGGGRVSWTARRTQVDLTGGWCRSAVAAGATGVRRARPDDVLLVLTLPSGEEARVLLHEGDAATLLGLLRRGGARAARTAGGASLPDPPRRASLPWWSWAGALLGTVALVLLVWLAVMGQRVTATVTASTGDGYCRVSWVTGEGAQGQEEIDCADEPAGAERDVWVAGWPFAGEAGDYASTNWVLGVTAGLLLVVPAGLLVRMRAERPTGGAPVPDPPGPPVPALDPDRLASAATPDDLLRAVTPHAVQQLPSHGWEDDARPRGAADRPVHDVLRALAGPAVALVVVLGLTSPWPWRAYVLATSEQQTARGVVGEVVVDGPGPVPEDLSVELTLSAGRRVSAEVAATRPLAGGSTVTVSYVGEDARAARLVGEADGLPRALALAVVGVVGAAGVAALRMVTLVGARRAVARAADGPRRPVVATLTADHGGDPLLLLADRALTPPVLLAVPVEAPLPRDTVAQARRGPMAGAARGRLTEGEPLFVTLEGLLVPLRPAGPAWRPEPDELVDLLDSAGALRRAVAPAPAVDDQLPAGTPRR